MTYQPDPSNRRLFRNDTAGIRFVLGDSADEEGAYLSPSERAVTIYYSDEVLGGIVRETQDLVAQAGALGMTDEEAKALLASEIECELANFHGSESLHGYHRTRLLLTDGAAVFAELAGAYWLIDIIASVQHLEKVKEEPHQFWTLLRKGSEADVFCHDGNLPEGKHDKVWRNPTDLKEWGRHLHYHQHIDYTDIVFDRFDLYAVEGEAGRTIMLKAEY